MSFPISSGAFNSLLQGRRFGSFGVKKYKGCKGRNPKTGKPIKVNPKELPSFKCGKELREIVDTYK